MKKALVAFVPLAILTSLGVLLYFEGFIGDSPARVTREHSISLPLSATNIHCDGTFAITTLGDFSAYASFEVAQSDLPGILSQFRMERPPEQDGNQTVYSFESRDGNFGTIRTSTVANSRVAVSIGTSWN